MKICERANQQKLGSPADRPFSRNNHNFKKCESSDRLKLVLAILFAIGTSDGYVKHIETEVQRGQPKYHYQNHSSVAVT